MHCFRNLTCKQIAIRLRSIDDSGIPCPGAKSKRLVERGRPPCPAQRVAITSGTGVCRPLQPVRPLNVLQPHKTVHPLLATSPPPALPKVSDTPNIDPRDDSITLQGLPEAQSVVVIVVDSCRLPASTPWQRERLRQGHGGCGRWAPADATQGVDCRSCRHPARDHPDHADSETGSQLTECDGQCKHSRP